jgi:hypothetical protein
MKKIFSTLIAILTLVAVKAQTSGAVITTNPSSFTAEDVVTITIDVSAVGNLAGKSPLYMWTWNPGNPAPGNGDWTNSNEARKLTNVGPNKWAVTMKPTEFYGKAPSEVTKIEFLVKAKDGSGDQKTNDIALTVDPLVFVPTVFRTYPRFIGKNEFVTGYLDQNLATDITTTRLMPTTCDVTVLNAQGNAIATVNLPVRNEGNKLWSVSLYPTLTFSLTPAQVADKLRFKFKGTVLGPTGAPVNAETPVYEKIIDDIK